jgi:diguanylate cyclase (GGDEF)-like protein
VLTEFALRLKGCLRVTDFAARLGGDEFVVLVDDADTPETPEVIARKVIAAMRRPIAIGDMELHITTSIGIAFHRSAVAKRDDLLQAADKALYAAKAAGRDTYHTAIVDEAAQ